MGRYIINIPAEIASNFNLKIQGAVVKMKPINGTVSVIKFNGLLPAMIFAIFAFGKINYRMNYFGFLLRRVEKFGHNIKHILHAAIHASSMQIGTYGIWFKSLFQSRNSLGK